ncbi:hypothetical protein CWS02_04270 [Enterobacter sp. EA-1]|nr:hypothetical protein CWS02_04270 [Enterobacter sp. EA-1]
MNTLAFSALNDDSYGAGNSLLTLVQLLSMMLGIAISFAFSHPLRLLGRNRPWSVLALFRLMGCGLLVSAALFSRLGKAQDPPSGRWPTVSNRVSSLWNHL